MVFGQDAPIEETWPKVLPFVECFLHIDSVLRTSSESMSLLAGHSQNLCFSVSSLAPHLLHFANSGTDVALLAFHTAWPTTASGQLACCCIPHLTRCLWHFLACSRLGMPCSSPPVASPGVTFAHMRTAYLVARTPMMSCLLLTSSSMSTHTLSTLQYHLSGSLGKSPTEKHDS